MYFIIRVIQIFVITFTQEYSILLSLSYKAKSNILSYYYWKEIHSNLL